MDQDYSQASAKKAWAFVLAIVCLMAIPIGLALLMMFGLSIVEVIVAGLMVVGTCIFLVFSGYYIALPSVGEIQSTHGRGELQTVAEALFIPADDDDARLRRRIIAFLEDHQGTRKVWVAPRRLLAAVDVLSGKTVSTEPRAVQSDGLSDKKTHTKLTRKLRKS